MRIGEDTSADDKSMPEFILDAIRWHPLDSGLAMSPGLSLRLFLQSQDVFCLWFIANLPIQDYIEKVNEVS